MLEDDLHHLRILAPDVRPSLEEHDVLRMVLEITVVPVLAGPTTKTFIFFISGDLRPRVDAQSGALLKAPVAI